jgi:propionyl-CoA carboxylase beta chain
VEGAVNLLFKRELKADQSRRNEITTEYKSRFANPYKACEAGFIDAVILPSETRETLLRALSIQRNKRLERPARKHGNIPL